MATLGRPPVKKRELLRTLRKQIVLGELAPASRLPPHRALSERFDASPMTVHHALAQLAREGFIEARGRQGTFVVDRPPHLSNFALVLPVRPGDGPTNRFLAALANEARRWQGEAGAVIGPWHEIDSHADNESFQQLCGDVRRRRLAGLIFATPPYELEGTPLIDEPGVPRVTIANPSHRFPNVARVHLDPDSFIDQALDHMQARGVKRLGLLLPLQSGADDWGRAYRERADARGMQVRPYWVQHVSPGSAPTARNLTHLMMRPDQADRPDGLIVADDNLVEYAAAGLVDSGAAESGAVEVLSHCNFPWPVPSVVPMRRLGYDAQQVLDACVALLQRQVGSRKSPGSMTANISAVFEERAPSNRAGMA